MASYLVVYVCVMALLRVSLARRLLTAELHAASDELDGAVCAFLALALVDLGREREAVAVSLTALSHYLPRYNGSLARQCALTPPSSGDAPAC